MLHYDRIEVSESIDVNKASESKESDVCHCWFLLMCINVSYIPILNIKSTDYRYVISGISKSKSTNIM